jgi:uncharacterized protein (TIGR02246 family)
MKAVLGVMIVPLATTVLLAQTPVSKPSVTPPRSPTYPAPVAQKSDPALEQLARDYETAFNKGDGKALAALYATDALRVTPTGHLITGQAAIENDYLTNLAGPFKGTKLLLHPGKTQTLTADVALIEGTYEVTGGTTPVKGRYLNTVVKQSGQWRLASVVTVPEQPAPPK